MAADGSTFGTLAAGNVRGVDPARKLNFFIWLVLAVHIFECFARTGVISYYSSTSFFVIHFSIFLIAWLYVFNNPNMDLKKSFVQLFILFLFIAFMNVGLSNMIIGYVAKSNLSMLFTILVNAFTNFFLTPWWLFYALFIQKMAVSRTQQTFGMLIIMLYIILALVAAIQSGIVPVPDAQVSMEQAGEAKKIWDEVKSIPQKVAGGIAGGLTKSSEKLIEFAAGDYYTGKVEKNKEEPLGVYLTNVKPSDTYFEYDEPVVLWGEVKARTLEEDKELLIGVSCRALSPGTNVYGITGDAAPEDKDTTARQFTMANFEIQDFMCQFEPKSVAAGNVQAVATFDFTTMAYIKSYFMDKERVRALRKQNLDPLAQFGIKDKSPTAIFTNGPVKIGMEAGKSVQGSLVPVETNINPDEGRNPTRFKLGVTIEKNPGWDGKIKKINELIVMVPNSMELSPDSCDFNIEETACQIEYGCFQLGKDTVKVYKLAELSTGEMIREGKRGYKPGRDKMIDMEGPKSFNCDIELKKNPDVVLGKTPVATNYFRAYADYTFEVVKNVPVSVRGVAAVPVPIYGQEFLTGYTVPRTDPDIIKKIWQNYKAALEKGSAENNIPVGVLVAQIAGESRGDPLAVSTTGAAGLTQFTYGTAREYKDIFTNVVVCCGLDSGEESPFTCINERKACGERWCQEGGYKCTLSDSRFNPALAMQAQARYMNVLTSQYRGRGYAGNDAIKLGLAAYNTGSGMVNWAIKNIGGHPSWNEISAYISTHAAEFDAAAGIPGKWKEASGYPNRIWATKEKFEQMQAGGELETPVS